MKRALHLVQRALHVLQIFLQLWWEFLFVLRPFSWKGPYMLCKVIPSKPRRTQCALKRALLVLQFFLQDSKMQHFRIADTMSFCDSFQNSRYNEFSSYLLFIFKKLSSLIVSATHFRIADFFGKSLFMKSALHVVKRALHVLQIFVQLRGGFF